ncbi:hypothetical protein TRVL_07776 [Trypanosoma vivax]|nr:hypothetical protein TRVL_07776 [Trypanosoma vivax]
MARTVSVLLATMLIASSIGLATFGPPALRSCDRLWKKVAYATAVVHLQLFRSKLLAFCRCSSSLPPCIKDASLMTLCIAIYRKLLHSALLIQHKVVTQRMARTIRHWCCARCKRKQAVARMCGMERTTADERGLLDSEGSDSRLIRNGHFSVDLYPLSRRSVKKRVYSEMWKHVLQSI